MEQDHAWWREVWLLGAGRLCESSKGVLIHMINALLPLDTVPVPQDIDWHKAALAGEALLEQPVGEKLAGKPAYRAVQNRVRGWLARCLEEGRLAPRERAEAGDVLGRLGDPRAGVGLDEAGLPDIAWVDIAGGEFLMGEEEARHTVTVSAFRIARYPVTHAQYAAFIRDSGHERPPFSYELQRYGNRPVIGVNWNDAVAFCRWLADRRGENIRLPTEAEWEYAAHGPESWRYAWGDEDWEPERANFRDSGIHHASSVGMYPCGMTPHGIYDITGNVWEWTSSVKSYPYIESDGRENPESDTQQVIRGGSWDDFVRGVRAAYRGDGGRTYRIDALGFRCARVQA